MIGQPGARAANGSAAGTRPQEQQCAQALDELESQAGEGACVRAAPLPRVLIADTATIRLGVRLALHGFAKICAEADDVASAIRAAQLHQPDACLVGDGLGAGVVDAVRGISMVVPGVPIVVLAEADNVQELIMALRAGATGYLLAGAGAPQLRRVLEVVLSDETAVPRSMVRHLVEEVRALDLGADQDHLTSRQSEVLIMLRRGLSTTSIASDLSISPITVRRHISRLVHKAGVHDRADLLDNDVEPPGPDQLPA